MLLMSGRTKVEGVRRRPQQRRAQVTVGAMLDAVIKILKRGGIGAVTTNRIAEVAGVSIGSVYQYFPDKQAIFDALHRRHVEEMDGVIAAALLDHADESVEQLICGLFDVLVDAHIDDPELHELLMSEVPHRVSRTEGLAIRLQGLIRLAMAAGGSSRRDLDQKVYVAAHMVEALAHAVALHRPKGVSLREAREEATKAIRSYLRAA